MGVILAIIFVAMTVNSVREPDLITPPSELKPSLSRPAPELAEDRKVIEVDCTKPVDVSSGNLRCK